MKLKEYVENINKFLKDNPELSELDVWTLDDDEGNSASPANFYGAIYYIPKDSSWYTDEMIHEEDSEEFFNDDYSTEDYKKVVFV